MIPCLMRARRLLATLMAAAITVAAAAGALDAAGGDAKGSLSYKGKTVPLVHAHLIKGPDQVDPGKTIRRIILVQQSIEAKIRACRTMSCVDGEITEGMEVDLDAGPRLNYWVAISGGRIQYSGTARPAVLRLTAEDGKRLAGTLSLDDTGAGGPRVEADFDAPLLKEFTAAR